MKKNLFLKNDKIQTKKIIMFEHNFLIKAVVSNFYLSNEGRTKFGFLAQLIRFRKGRCLVTNSRSQCFLTWRTGSFYSFFKLTRLTLRENFSFGFVKGLRKSSW